jgi:HK97 family phage major capsid protein
MGMNAIELRQKNAALYDQMKVITDKASAEKRSLNADERPKWDAMWTEFEQNRKTIDTEERMEEAAKTLETRSEGPKGGKKAEPGQDPVPEKRSKYATEEYRAAFFDYIRSGNTDKLREMRAQTEGTGSQGGVLVPVTLDKKIINLLSELNVVRAASTVIVTENQEDIPVVGSHGSAGWTAEGGATVESDEAFGKVSLKANKADTMILISEELLSDSVFDLEAYLAGEFARRFSVIEEAAFISGDGVGKPNGILTTSTIKNSSTTAASNAIAADDIKNMFFSLAPQYRKNASWLLSDSVIKLIAMIKDSYGQYMWTPGLSNGQEDKLLGRPVMLSSSAPVFAAGAPAGVFGDFSYYWIADRGMPVFQRLNERYAELGQVGFRAYKRVDGAVTNPNAFSLFKIKA